MSRQKGPSAISALREASAKIQEIGFPPTAGASMADACGWVDKVAPVLEVLSKVLCAIPKVAWVGIAIKALVAAAQAGCRVVLESAVPSMN